MSGSAPQPSDEEANLPGWPPLGRLLVDGGLVSEAQLDQALAEQRRHGARLGDIVLAKGWVSRLALASAVAHQHGLELSVTAEAEKLPKAALKPGTWKPLGQLLIDRGLITHMQLQQTIAEQRTTGHRLGEILVARNWLTPIMLMRVLDEQQGLGLAEQSLDVRASSSEEPTEQYDVEQKRDGSMPTLHSRKWLSTPERPNRRIKARPITNGGVMIGRIDIARNNFLSRKLVRATTSANARPSAVVPAPQINASRSVFHATPQRGPPVRQPNPHTFCCVKRPRNAAIENAPPSSSNALTRILSTGKNVKIAVDARIATMHPAIKPSPLKLPRSARPSANSIANAEIGNRENRDDPNCGRNGRDAKEGERWMPPGPLDAPLPQADRSRPRRPPLPNHDPGAPHPAPVTRRPSWP